jgi:hypothetical protein
MLARDRQIPAWRGEISAENGDLSIPFEQTGYPLNAYKIDSKRRRPVTLAVYLLTSRQ